MSETGLVIATWALVAATIVVAMITLMVTWRGWRVAAELAHHERAEQQKIFYANWRRSETLRGLAQVMLSAEKLGLIRDNIFALSDDLRRGAVSHSAAASSLVELIAKLDESLTDIGSARAMLDLIASVEVRSAMRELSNKGAALFYAVERSREHLQSNETALLIVEQLARSDDEFGDALMQLRIAWDSTKSLSAFSEEFRAL